MKKEKETRVLEILTEKKRIEVTELASLLNVSQVTVRKYLDELEGRKLITREHGCAVLNSADDINGRLAYHYEEKLQIAEKAAELIHDGDTVMIESGSCCALAALLIAQKKKNVTIVTNSAFIADYIRRENGAQTVLLGGIYQPDSQCLVGPMIRDGAANYHVRYFFIGTDGWSERTGFTNKDQMRAQAVRDMAASAENMVVLTESDKFLSPGTVPMNIKNQPKLVITDQNIPEQAQRSLQEEGIEILL